MGDIRVPDDVSWNSANNTDRKVKIYTTGAMTDLPPCDCPTCSRDEQDA